METILRAPAVKARTGLGLTSIYTLEGFPKPVKLGPRASGWLESEINAWILARAEQSRPSAEKEVFPAA
jgi:prophage regulatory protein